MVCDSNILIYTAENDGTICQPYAESPDALIASITRIEVLGFRGFANLSEERQSRLFSIVKATTEVPLDDEIIECAIALRQQKSMKLGDAIIAATALEYGLPLVTRNEDDFKHISGLKIINPFAPG
jgi:predicted nucleic acid-binding protein